MLNFDGTVYVSDSWGGVYTVYDDRILIEPVAYTQELQPGETKETGVILYADQYPDLVKYSIKTEGVSQCVSMEETTAVTVDEPENNVTENTARKRRPDRQHRIRRKIRPHILLVPCMYRERICMTAREIFSRSGV